MNNNVSYATSDEDWNAWREEEESADSLYEASHPESEE